MLYNNLPKELEEKMLADLKSGSLPEYGFDSANALRRNASHDKPTTLRTAFIRDAEKILHCPYYNRYADKTQVFSFYKNDDITRRALHVQLVSRIARTIGRALNLELDLIEAIALGHDIGHTPFGHAGESFLDSLLYAESGRHFSHNIHSVRVLDEIFPLNLTLQTLNGIASHDGEMELDEYRPREISGFEEFDSLIKLCNEDKANVRRLIPCTLEGCVVRISDIIAYLGKDRQDAERAKLQSGDAYTDGTIGKSNSEIINNLTVNIVTHSYNKPYIKMDKAHFDALKQAKNDNYALIYKTERVEAALKGIIAPMMSDIFYKMLDDLKKGDKTSPVYRHHIAFVDRPYYAEKRREPYLNSPHETIVADYIASMTDDYLIDLHAHLFPNSSLTIEYKGYFDD